MIYKPNTPYYAEFITSSPNTGGVKNADSLPTAVATKNGTDDGSFSLTVANIDTGRYKVTGTIPAGYSAGDSVQISVSATVDGVADKLVVHNFLVDTKRTSDLKDFDYSNQACILTSDYNAAKVASSQTSVNAIASNVTDIKTLVEHTTNGLAAIRTVINDVNAKTTNLPVDPSSAATIAAAFATVNSYVDGLESAVALIKAQTDRLLFDDDDLLKTFTQKGQVMLPLMELNVPQYDEYRPKVTVLITRGDNPSIPIRLNRDCNGYTGVFAAKANIDDVVYAMPKRNVRWEDASIGFGWVDITKTDTADVGVFFGEVELNKGAETITVNEILRVRVVKDIVRE